ncbi:MAG: FdhF/YdeP family oxidoreductase [Cellulomonadaceae bacterium]|nr:FdhF/YdeP family oxidoreductase [Cellulomonadaceae bacterium]
MSQTPPPPAKQLVPDTPDDQRVPGVIAEVPRQGGLGPRTNGEWSHKPYHHPAAGWGATMSVGHVLIETHELARGSKAMFTMNQPGVGFDCPGCAWPNDSDHLALDICENGIKHATAEMTSKRTDRTFFAKHTVTDLADWTDFELEDHGRLTEPFVYDAASDHYVPISWDEAFALIGDELRALDSPDQASFYTSGRLSNEGSFLYQWFAREYGTNNLPDCSNMCHESTGRALTASIATGKGTVDLSDWKAADAIFIVGANSASNTPRMLTSLADAARRGATIVHVNPLVESGATRTIVPHEFADMATFHSTPISAMNLQVRPSGDFAFFRGVAKAVLEADAAGVDGAIDKDFLDAYTKDFDAYRAIVTATPWETLTVQAGLTEQQIRGAADVYLGAKNTIIGWCLGLTQQEHAVDAIREIMNLLLLRGNIGRPGAGPGPIRGHSNVQGNRTCGIDHHPKEPTLQKIDAACGITSPRGWGKGTVDTLVGMHDGDVKVFVAVGGNFLMAAPDTRYTAEALARCNLTVHVSTKLNRSHLAHGAKALILPCLARSERDETAAGLQSVSTEDSMSWVQLSCGKREPASDQLRSEVAIIAGMAATTLPDTTTRWAWLAQDNDRIRDVMAAALPGFDGFNELVRRKRGFRIPQGPRDRVFATASGRAEFSLADLPDAVPADPDTIVLQTMRSHDQWNTTIYSTSDRYRGIHNIREIIMMHADDMAARGIASGDCVDITATSKDGSQRTVRQFRAIGYDLPQGSAAGYMPELNLLVGAADMSPQSDQPLTKSLQVKVVRSAEQLPTATAHEDADTLTATTEFYDGRPFAS